MRAYTITFPFLAILFLALALLIREFNEDVHVFFVIGTLLAAGLLLVWLILNKAELKKAFYRKGTKYGTSSGLSVLFGSLIVIGVAGLSTKKRFDFSVDLTRLQSNSLSDESLKVVEAVNARQLEIDVLAFFDNELIRERFIKLINMYARSGLSVKAQYLDPKMEPTKALAEEISASNTVIIRRGGKEVRITGFTEDEFTNALVRIMKDNNKSVYFITGHGEPDIDDEEGSGYSTIKKELIRNRYDVTKVALTLEAQIPERADLLVIAGPKYDLKEGEIAIISDYLISGKPLLVMVDALADVANLNRLLSVYGLLFESDILLLRPEDPRTKMFGQSTVFVSEFEAFHAVTKDFATRTSIVLMFPQPRSLVAINENENRMKVEIIGKTTDQTIGISNVNHQRDMHDIKKDQMRADSFGVIGAITGRVGGRKVVKDEIAPSNGIKTNVSAEQIDTVARELRIIAIGSAQFVNNIYIKRRENLSLFMNTVNYLVHDEDFITIKSPNQNKSTIDLTSESSQIWLLIVSYVYPFTILGLGLLIIWKRKLI